MIRAIILTMVPSPKQILRFAISLRSGLGITLS